MFFDAKKIIFLNTFLIWDLFVHLNNAQYQKQEGKHLKNTDHIILDIVKLMITS